MALKICPDFHCFYSEFWPSQSLYWTPSIRRIFRAIGPVALFSYFWERNIYIYKNRKHALSWYFGWFSWKEFHSPPHSVSYFQFWLVPLWCTSSGDHVMVYMVLTQWDSMVWVPITTQRPHRLFKECRAFSINICLFPNLITTATIVSPHPYVILLWGWFINSVQQCRENVLYPTLGLL